MDQIIAAKLRAAALDFYAVLPDGAGRSMLAYGLNLQNTWHDLLGELPISQSSRILDVGCGYGVLSLELALNGVREIFASDINPDFIKGAENLTHTITEQGGLNEDCIIDFKVDDITSLSDPDDYFDFVIVREVFSYLSKPADAANHLFRVTKPNGVVCVEDIDDRLYFTFPPPSQDFNALFEAVDTLQSAKGGDREVGRKLSVYLGAAGFKVTKIVVPTEPLHLRADPATGEGEFVINQFVTLKQQIVDANLMTPEQFDCHIEAMRKQVPFDQFRMNGRIVVFATKQELT